MSGADASVPAPVPVPIADVPDPVGRVAFARAARDAFLTSWAHGGLLSCAENVARLAGAGEPGDWKALASELAVGMRREADRNPSGYVRTLEKPPHIARGIGASTEPKGLPSGKKGASTEPKGIPSGKKGASTELKGLPPGGRRRPWDAWSSSSSDGDDSVLEEAAADYPSGDEEPPRVDKEYAGAVDLYRHLLSRGRFPEALLAGVRLAGRSGRGREDAWAWALQAARLAAEDAEDDGEPPAKALERVRFAEAVASVDMAFFRRGSGASESSRSRPARKVTPVNAAGFESALAAVLSVCSGCLPVRRGWRSALDATRAISEAYESALCSVPMRSSSTRRDGLVSTVPDGARAKVVVVPGPGAGRKGGGGRPRERPRGRRLARQRLCPC
jgi:hypothetical protein